MEPSHPLRVSPMTSVEPGDLLRLADAEYRYGDGPLTVRVTAVFREQPDPEFLHIQGLQILWDGSRGKKRFLAVLREAIPKAKSRTE